MVSRRRFVSAGIAITGDMLVGTRFTRAIEDLDPRVNRIVTNTIGIDTHNHIDVPLTAAEMPGADIDLAGEMKRSGLSAILHHFCNQLPIRRSI